jgi:hypothetical protein
MNFFFCFRINPAPKVCGLVPLKISIYITTIFSMLYGIINIGVFLANDPEKLKNFHYYMFQTYQVISTLLVFLTFFFKKKNILLTSIRMHTSYITISIIFIVYMFISVFSNKFNNDNIKNILYIFILIQIGFTVFSLYANYIFCSLYVHFKTEILNESNVTTTPLREIQSTNITNTSNIKITDPQV